VDVAFFERETGHPATRRDVHLAAFKRHCERAVAKPLSSRTGQATSEIGGYYAVRVLFSFFQTHTAHRGSKFSISDGVALFPLALALLAQIKLKKHCEKMPRQVS
jgi:hypothetical protein